MVEKKLHDLTGLERSIEELALSAARRPTYGGGGGDDGIMERLAVVEARLGGVEGRMDRLESHMGRLEGRMDGIDGRLRGVETSLAALSRDVAHLPSKGFIVTVLLATLAVIAGLVTFSENIRVAIGL